MQRKPRIPVHSRNLRGFLVATALAALSGCQGTLGGSQGEDDESGTAGGGDGDAFGPIAGDGDGDLTLVDPTIAGDANACDLGIDAGFSGLRRLTRAEYKHAARDLFATPQDVGHEGLLPLDEFLGNFSFNLNVIDQVGVEQHLSVGETVAIEASENLAGWLPCDPGVDGEAECARTTIEIVGRRAYRRPLEPAEVERLLGIYTAAREDADFGNGIKVLVEAILSSPHFLYVLEFGLPNPAETGVVPLSDFEMASRLSFLIWRSGPDEALLTAAESGELGTRDALKAQALRMLQDERARDGVTLFHEQWLRLGVNHDGEPIDENAGVQDTVRTVESLIFDESSTLADLFTVPYGYLNEETRDLYGVTTPPTGPDDGGFARYDLNPDQRGGILARVGFLKSNDNPSRRGKFVREQMLCSPIPPPPPGVDTELPPLQPGQSPREQWNAHVELDGCGTCHRMMDYIGFGFDHYDHHGHWRELVDDTWPVEDEGEMVGTSDIDGPFEGAQELQARLATSVDVRACFSYQWIRFATGRDPGAEDACSLATANSLFRAGDYNIQELIVAVVQTDSFRYRRETAQ